MKHNEPRGFVHMLEPALQRKVEKEVRQVFSKLWKVHLDNWFAIRRARRAVNLALYGDEFGPGPSALQRRVSKKR